MSKILIVDDEQDLCEILSFNLQSEGYETDTANSAEEALGMMASGHSYDLLLLDVMMDRMSGFEMAAMLRGRGDNTPVIFLTARDAHDDEMEGFGAGADDYITKPFSFDTVLARVKAVLRRSGERRAESGELRTLSTLTRREHLILELFREHPGRFFTREEILAAVWPGDALVGERSVDVHIARLRKKLGAEGQRIVNKTGFGYGLV
ncbi:MAG: response regulator transcription factor [Bacteroidales bacterium]|nr:response regulator transcription factor [Bacteroidales bacterium]